MRLVPALLFVALLSAGCSSAKPKPTGAGSTPVLCLLRDWRGVWSGPMKDSPMGPMTYTLWVEDAGEYLKVTSAPLREAGLDTIKHTYKLVQFDQGVPYIEYDLAQRATVHRGTVLYREPLSTDEEAVFCAEDGGCDKVKFVISQTGEQSLSFHTMIAEAPHAEWALRYTSAEIPKDRGLDVDRPEPTEPKPKKKPARQFDEHGNPLDTDLYLEDHQDQDVGEKKPKK